MVLMGVRQDDQVEMSVPERDPLVEPTDEQVGVGPAVDEHPPAIRGLEEDRIALADIEDGDLQEDPVARHEDQGERRHERRGGEDGWHPTATDAGSGWLGRRPGEGLPGCRVSWSGPDRVQRGRQARARDPSAEEVEWRGQLHAREGDTGEKSAAADHGRQRHPGQQADRCNVHQ
jgi:hypothetical protein